MIKHLLLLLFMTSLITPFNSFADKANVQNSIEARYAYTMGYRIGQMLKSQGMKQLDNKNFIQGIDDFFNEKEPRLDEVEMKDAVTMYQQYQKKLRKRDPKANLSEALSFLAENKSKPGVTELPSGLQYEVLNPAEGVKPQSSDTVEIHYQGTLLNGDVFDSSLNRGKPAIFPLEGVIPGFREAIINMHIGEKWRVYIPPSMAYGEKGTQGPIGPNEMLIFEIELLSIQ